MKVSESYNKINNNGSNSVIEAFKKKANEYASQGFDEDLVAELLQADGCDIDLSKKIAETGVDSMPEDYIVSTPPKSYEDLKNKIDDVIRNGDIDKLEIAISNKEITDLIRMARSAHSEEFFDQAHRDIRDIVDGMIIDNIAVANMNEDIEEPSEKEKVAENLLGVWTANSIKSFNKKEATKKEVIKKTKHNNIPLIF